MEKKENYKFLVVSDIHDDIDKVKILVDKYKDTKFDYVFCCGDAIDVPIGKNDVKEVTDEYVIKLKDIYTELAKLAPILWVPGNHEPGFYFKEDLKEEVIPNSFNLHKKIKKLDEKLYIVGLGGSIPIMTGKRWKHDFVYFKELNLETDFKYGGYPYNVFPNSFHKSDHLFINDLNDTIDQAKKEGGDDIQIVYLTHLGPLYTSTNTIVENGEVLYLGSKKFGEKFLQEDNGFIIIHGHSHSAEGFVTLRTNKHIFNPGACMDGHYGIIELKKSKEGIWGVSSSTIAYL
jgi:Icc-related predicted phosphoesterase